MPISDSVFTNPDALRLLYLSPKNPNRETADISAPQSLVAPPPPIIIDPPPRDPPCPAVGQYTAALLNGTSSDVRTVQVERLRLGHDQLWDPISQTFKRIAALSIVPGVACVRYRTLDGAESVVSIYDFVIRNFKDETGRMIAKMMQEQDEVHGSVSLIGRGVNETEIDWIADAGIQSVVKITLEGEKGGRYASGTDPRKMTMRHNNKPVDPLE
jgi:hypothetical protein